MVEDIKIKRTRNSKVVVIVVAQFTRYYQRYTSQFKIVLF